MENKELIQDTGLFIGQTVFEFSLAESFEAITNIFETIKQYREFASPDEAAWFDYIREIFHIFGFSTVNLAPRLIAVQEMGANQTPNALVCIVGPKEDFNQIAFGIDWESYLFYAAKFHQVQWVILTNGLQFKVLNCANGPDRRKFFECELDEIIRDGRTDSFITLYKIFHVINTSNESKTSNQNPDIKKTGGKGKRVVAKRHLTRKEFWEQLISRSKSRTQLFSSRSPGIDNWLSIGAGKTGISYNYVIMKAGARVELYIDNGHADWNKSVFDSLSKSRTKIEEEFGHSLIWERLENKRASRVQFSLNQFGLQNNSKWPELQDQMIEAMIKFEKSFRPFIQKIG